MCCCRPQPGRAGLGLCPGRRHAWPRGRLAVGIAMIFAVHIEIADWRLVLFHAVAASLLLSILGILAALWAEKFDHIAAVTNFLVMPLSFCPAPSIRSSVCRRHFMSSRNSIPFFYMIDGFRAGSPAMRRFDPRRHHRHGGDQRRAPGAMPCPVLARLQTSRRRPRTHPIRSRRPS